MWSIYTAGRTWQKVNGLQSRHNKAHVNARDGHFLLLLLLRDLQENWHAFTQQRCQDAKTPDTKTIKLVHFRYSTNIQSKVHTVINTENDTDRNRPSAFQETQRTFQILEQKLPSHLFTLLFCTPLTKLVE